MNAEIQMMSALTSGITDAATKFDLNELFGASRQAFQDSVKAITQRKAGPLIVFDNIYLADLNPPEEISKARVVSAKKETEYQTAQRQRDIDSVSAQGVVLSARGKAEAARLEAQAIASSPDVLRLRGMQAMAEGLSKICAGATTCIVGGTVTDKFMALGNGKQ